MDLSRARYMADPVALWRHAYDEAGQIMQHDFWVQDMAGVDWAGVLAAYRPLLDRIAGREDFADLLWEVFGELGTSHAYVRPGRPRTTATTGRTRRSACSAPTSNGMPRARGGSRGCCPASPPTRGPARR